MNFAFIFRIDYLNRVEWAMFHSNLKIGPGWIIKKEYLQELKKNLRKYNIGYKEIPRKEPIGMKKVRKFSLKSKNDRDLEKLTRLDRTQTKLIGFIKK